MSIAGGVSLAFERGAEVGCSVMQIFVKNNNRWRGASLTDEEVEAFWKAREVTGIWPVFAHNTYLVNLASPDPATRERSVACTVDELERCSRLGLPWLVIHPGAHLGAGIERGIERLARNLNRVFEKTPQINTRILLETTAGQGTTMGRSTGELALMMERIDAPERLGVCLDTCHVFAAGYDMRSPEAWERTVSEFADAIGLEQIRAMHVNDSLKPLGSHRDRHAHIGEGEIGDEGFRNLMRDPRFRRVPKVLETPKENEADLRNLQRLRHLAGSD
ncbi:deoxyribonuclease IV [Gemmatimonadota bacterium]